MSDDTTPIRKQYLELKSRYPDTILFFRLGDFYETFDADAELVAEELDIVLTSRPVAKGVRIPMAGVPYHAVEGYVARLIEKGYRVALAEQVGEPGGRGPMERRVERVVTPGTLLEPALLDEKRPNYLAAILIEGERAGIAYAEISTGEFGTTQVSDDGDILTAVRQELARLQPREVLFPKLGSWKERTSDQPETRSEELLAGMLPAHFTPWAAYRFEESAARQLLLEHFGVQTLEGFGCEGKPLAVRAAGAILAYLQETQQGTLPQIVGLATYSTEHFMAVDPATWRNLELTETLRREKRGSLLGVLDMSVTAMGGRLLLQRLQRPLLDIVELETRLDQVQAFVENGLLRASARRLLKQVPDIERMINRVTAGKALPRDLMGIRLALEAVPELCALLEGVTEAPAGFSGLQEGLEALPDVAALIASALVDDPPAQASAGGLIRPGFSAELDGIILASRDAREWIASLESKERARTGIKNLKVGYNKVFGYYIEVTRSNTDAVPADYIRKQTLVNAERYITPDLKEYESLVLNAEERINELEARLFRELCAQVAARSGALLALATALARLDVAAALAEVAARYHYVRPTFTPEPVLEITAGRHPVVERTLSEPFAPNDLRMDDANRIHIITGPNMAGKCLSADTLIPTDHGLLPIQALCDDATQPDTFTSLEVGIRGKCCNTTSSHFYNGGIVPTLEIRTSLGYNLTGTPAHRVWVRRKDGSEAWVRLDELTLTDYVALQPGTELWGQATSLAITPSHSRGAISYTYPTEMTPDFAYFIGILLGDGNYSRQQVLRITTADELVAQEFCRIAETLFGYSPKSTQKRGTIARDFLITSLDIRCFMAQLGLDYVISHQKSIPEIILRAPRASVIGLLQGLFDTDASANSRYGNIEYSTTSPILAQQVQLLLLNLGIVSSLQQKRTPARLSYRLSIRGADAIAFYRIIGFRLPRKQARSALTSNLRHPNIGGIPYLTGVLRTIQQRIVATKNKPVALKHNKAINSIFYTYIPSGRNISYAKMQELLIYCRQSQVPCPELDSLLENRYFYDRLSSVTPGETQQVFDLSVPQGHAYVAGGFVSHNSVFLRQSAHIVLMAQIGSYVPADAAHIGIVDRIFTRIGASDELAAGQSTFMVEMVETAGILNHATPQSLLVLDEVGRGTSTYDGMAIAWAVVEYLHNHPERRARTLFATHYHELIEMEEHLPHIRNFNLAVVEEGKDVVFLHRVVPGGADRSYGIHVARLAGVPAPVVHRAEALLEQLESGEFRPGADEPEPFQPLLIAKEHPVVEALRTLDVNSLTPLDALTKLYEWQKLVMGEHKARKQRH